MITFSWLMIFTLLLGACLTYASIWKSRYPSPVDVLIKSFEKQGIKNLRGKVILITVRSLFQAAWIVSGW